VLKGADGAQNGFVLEATEDAADPGLAGLAWAPGGSNGQLLATAGDAAFSIDGLAITAAGNEVTDAIPGVTLNLTGTNAGMPTTITFSNPASAITSAMQDLTAALNEMVGAINEATDPKTGDLARDSGAQALRRSFSSLAGSILMPDAAEGAPRTLADLGLSTQRDGTYILDGERLAKTLASDPEAAAAMFTNGINGVFAKIDDMSRSAGRISDPGTLAGSISRYTEQLQQVSEDQAELVQEQEEVRARLASRFAVSENQIGTMKSTLSFLQNQIAAWNSSGD
jgi:flagellar hook-associated protein 2